MIEIKDTCAIVETPELSTLPVEQDYKHSLKRRHAYHYTDKPVYWYNPFDGRIITPTGKATIPASTSLTTLLEKIEFHAEKNGYEKEVSLYLVAGCAIKNRPPHRDDNNWFNVYRGWKLDKMLWDKLLAEYSHDGFKVSLYGTGSYWGEEKNLELMYTAWHTLEENLQRVFRVDGSYKLLADTPAQTGRELLVISLPKGKQYPRLSDDLLDLIVHNFGQARIETFSSQRDVLENGVYVIDGRWMYASCVRDLPIGPCYHDNKNEFVGVRRKDGKLGTNYCPGFYRVTVTVPEDWRHIGLIKSSQARTLTDESGYYPNIPGETFTNWTTSSEIALALDHGWHIQIHERIIWPDTGTKGSLTDPLETWLEKLIDLRSEVEQEYEKKQDKVLVLQKDAIRSIVLHTIGSFHQLFTYENHVTPLAELPIQPRYYDILGERSFHIYKTRKEGIYWRENIPLSEQRQMFIHPEMSAMVWGRARVKLAAFALLLPFEDIVSLRTDSVWCASLPDLVDTKRPGCFRLKDTIPGPWSWPKNGSEMRAIAIKRNLEQSDNAALQNEIGGKNDDRTV